MPPWKADPANGPFVGQQPLSDAEIQLLQRWADEGAAEGDPRDLPPARTWSEGWLLGKPDVVVTLPQPYTLAGGRLRCVPHLRHPDSRRRPRASCAAWSSVPAIRQSCTTRTSASIRTPASRRLDEQDPAPGYDGLIARSAIYPDGHFLGWTPGQVAPLLPKDLAWRLNTAHRPRRRAAHAAERQARGRLAVDRVVLR